MLSRIYWLDCELGGRLATMARPRGGEWLEWEIAGWKSAGIDTVVSLLERDEQMELDLQQEQSFCEKNGMDYTSFPIRDRGVPTSISETHLLVGKIRARLSAEKNAGIHCRAGIGRSSLIAACTLVTLGYDTGAAFETISKARGLYVPDTDEQREWVSRFSGVVGR